MRRPEPTGGTRAEMVFPCLRVAFPLSLGEVNESEGSMPQHLVVSDCMEGVVFVTIGGRICHIVQHWRVPLGTAVTSTLVDAIFGPLATLWTANMAPHCPPDTALAGFSLRDLRTQGMAPVNNTVAGGVGTGTGDRLPNQIAICLTVRTARAGKAFRGRNYWPGLSETASGPGGTLTAGAHTSIAAFATGYLTAVNRSGCNLVVLHRPLYGIDGSITVPGTIENATQVVLRDDVLDTQRRRAR